MTILVKDSQRVARMQKLYEAQRAAMPDVRQRAYRMAVEAGDRETAAVLAREIRNALLADSDREVVLDRLGLEMPEGTTFSVWLAFFKKLGQAVAGPWAAYRQQLRDLTQQEGFPLDIQWPEAPAEQEEK